MILSEEYFITRVKLKLLCWVLRLENEQGCWKATQQVMNNSLCQNANNIQNSIYKLKYLIQTTDLNLILIVTVVMINNASNSIKHWNQTNKHNTRTGQLICANVLDQEVSWNDFYFTYKKKKIISMILGLKSVTEHPKTNFKIINKM